MIPFPACSRLSHFGNGQSGKTCIDERDQFFTLRISVEGSIPQERRYTIEAIPQTSGLPTRTLCSQETFRFIALAPGEYSLRFQAEGCQTKRIDDVGVRKGEATWLDEVVLEPAVPTTEAKPETVQIPGSRCLPGAHLPRKGR